MIKKEIRMSMLTIKKNQYAVQFLLNIPYFLYFFKGIVI